MQLNSYSRYFKDRIESFDDYYPITGAGYHIYQPIEDIVLDDYEQFKQFGNPFDKFLRFVKTHLSNNQADKNNFPSLKSCLLRVPNSINSKYDVRVKVVHEWDGYRPHNMKLLGDFHVYLVAEFQKNMSLRKTYDITNTLDQANGKVIEWIEKLLQTPLEDFRKYCLWRILCPYLINIKKTSPEESFLILDKWLNKCDILSPITNKSKLIKDNLRYVKDYKPISLDKLKSENIELFKIIINTQ